MENKLSFVIVVLILALIGGFFFYDEKADRLEKEIQIITVEFNEKIKTMQVDLSIANEDQSPNYEAQDVSCENVKSINEKPAANINKNENTIALSKLEDLNNQLIKTRSELKDVQKKLLLASSKSKVLTDEFSQIDDARPKVKSLKKSLQSTKRELETADEKLKLSSAELETADKKLETADKKIKKLEKLKDLEVLFKNQNKTTIKKNIQRIEALKNAASGIAITGLIVPAIGVATLAAYTVEEIDNYCANIKSIIDLEQKIFGEVVSLDAKTQQDYNNQCIKKY